MLTIRAARAPDVALLRTMIRELAEFERELEWVTIEIGDLLRDGFGPHPKFRALIAEWEEKTAGYALFYGYYSTWVGAGLYLEDLFVREEFRGKGIGKGLLAAVGRVARDEKYVALRWEVLDWNRKAIQLYRALGAEFREEWTSVLLTGEALKRLGEESG
jgi:GNAT superfamily N-acetyltransferase